MKRLGFYICLACLAFACQKEDEITLGIGYENLYAIVDNPDDSIQHKRYELYTTYGVPVYFNDTIGKVFVTKDINGDSVFRYETLDLNWGFNNDNRGSVTYHVTRLTEPEQQMKALRFAEVFFQNSQPGLYPYALWLTESCYEISSSGATSKSMITRYRNLMFAGAQNLNEGNMQTEAVSYRNDIVKQKIQVYETELKAFHVVSKDYRKRAWLEFYPNEIRPYYSTIYPVWLEWYPVALEEEWDPALPNWTYRRYMTTTPYGNNSNDNFPMGVWTDEDFDNYVIYTRTLVGALGFVSYQVADPKDKKFTPYTEESDLDCYLVEMLKYPRKEFLERWGSCPLVLKKYEILYAIIRDKLGVEL